MSEPSKKLAHISITLLEGGVMRVCSTCADSFDSSYAPFADERLGVEVQKLVAEMRERLAGVALIGAMPPVAKAESGTTVTIRIERPVGTRSVGGSALPDECGGAQ